MLSNRELRDLGYYLISPEDSHAEEHRRMLTGQSVRKMADRCRRGAIRVNESRAAGVCKTMIWVVLSVVMGCGIGQLQ